MRNTISLIMLAAAQTIVWAGLFYLFPILLLRWEGAFGWERGEIALALTLALGVSALASPFMGRLIDRGLGRAVLTGSAAAGGLLLLALAAVESREAFYLVWALIGLTLAGCLYDPCFAFVTRVRGDKARGAITVITLIAGFASTICYPIADALAEAQGWRMAAAVFAGAILLGAVPLFAISTTWLARGGETPPPAEEAKGAAKAARANPVFWLLALAFPALAATHGMMISHIMPILADKGATGATAVLAASLIGPSQVLGRIAMTAFGRGVSAGALTLVSCFGVAAALALLLSASWIFAFVIVMGACYGVLSITKPLVIADLLGRRGYGAIAGALALPYVAATAAAPFLAVLLWRAGGYDLTLAAGAALALAGGAVLVLARRVAAIDARGE